MELRYDPLAPIVVEMGLRRGMANHDPESFVEPEGCGWIDSNGRQGVDDAAGSRPSVLAVSFALGILLFALGIRLLALAIRLFALAIQLSALGILVLVLVLALVFALLFAPGPAVVIVVSLDRGPLAERPNGPACFVVAPVPFAWLLSYKAPPWLLLRSGRRFLAGAGRSLPRRAGGISTFRKA